MIFAKKDTLFAIIGIPGERGRSAWSETIGRVGSIEIQLRAPHFAVETRVKGPRRDARAKGFRRLRDYARGKNRAHCKLTLGEGLVLQEERTDLFRVRVFPIGHIGSLPAPVDAKVRIVEMPAEMLAVEHITRRLTPQVIASVEARLFQLLQGSGWSRDLSDRCRLTESAGTLPFRPWGSLAIRVHEDLHRPTA